MTPNFSSRGHENKDINSYKISNETKGKKTEKNNIKAIYSSNLKEKTLLSKNNNNNLFNTEKKNIFEDLLLDDTKNTDYSSNKSLKEINESKEKNIITSKFNNIDERVKNENKKENI